MQAYLIRGGRVIDPVSRRDEIADVLVANGVVAEIGKSISPPSNATVIDAAG
jgi:dihydroorotase